MGQSEITFYAPGAAAYFVPASPVSGGGAERQVNLVSGALAQAGWVSRVLTITERRFTTDDGVEVQPCWRPGATILSRIWNLTRAISSSPSPVYIRLSRVSIDVLLVAVITRLRRKSLVIGVSNDPVCTRQGGLLTSLKKRLLYRISSVVLTQSVRQQELLVSNFVRRSRLLANAIDFDSYESARSTEFADRDIDVLWVGAIEPQKGTLDVLNIAAARTNLRFVLVGGPLPTSKEYFREVVSRAHDLPNVELAGVVPPHEIGDWYGRSKLLLHTSIPGRDGMTKEGFPNVMLEAWASGVPVVSMAHDPDSVIEKSGLGVVVSRDEGARVISELVADSSWWTEARNRSVEFAESRSLNDPRWVSKFEAAISR